MTAPALRAWQRDAIARYLDARPRDFLTTATPGAGKTTFALTLAQQLVSSRSVDRVIVVAPTDHLRTQWADAAARFGLTLDPTLSNAVAPVRRGADGYVTTYAQVAARPALHRQRCENHRSLVVLDEVHHAGDGLSWGDAVREAFDPAKRRIALTGTPFRTRADERIPFVAYEQTGDGELVSRADYAYGYREALADAVVRPVVFAAYTGTSRWVNSAGEVVAATLHDAGTRNAEQLAWRTALDPGGQWVPHVIAAIDERITHKREHGIPDAAGLILASDQDAARAYAKIAARVTGEKPVLILSDDPRASRKIEQFAHGTQRLAVCVRMISEGVDVPRAVALGWMTSYRTPLFFAQAVGRVVRARNPQEQATVFLPAVRPLLALAADLEEQRNQVVRVHAPADDELDEVTVERVAGEGGELWSAIGAEAEFAHVLTGGRAIAGAQGAKPAPGAAPLTVEDEDYLGLPGLLTPEQTASLLASRDVELRRRAGEAASRPEEELFSREEVGGWRDVADLRREINRLVARRARTSGRKHADIHLELRQAVPGPASSQADYDTLLARRDHLLGWSA